MCIGELILILGLFESGLCFVVGVLGMWIEDLEYFIGGCGLIMFGFGFGLNCSLIWMLKMGLIMVLYYSFL